MNILESIKLAFASIIMNKLRASLTLLSISIGVFSIMASGTLVTSIDDAISGELSALGENTFQIYRMPKISFGGSKWWKYRKRKNIGYKQYKELRKQMTMTKFISASSSSGGNKIEYLRNETDPDVSMIGTDENFFITTNENVIYGRPFVGEDIEFNRSVAVIGNDVAVKLFSGLDPLGKKIRIKNHQFEVVGILKAKGAILGQSQDNKVIIPLSTYLRYYANFWEKSLDIIVKAYARELLTSTIDESIGILRSVRNVKPWEENSFELETNESVSQQFSKLTGFIVWFGIICGGISLIAAGVGIMNIMLVTVKERTREIGVRKAVGAKKKWILGQFLIETVTLCQVGGIIGILLGIAGAATLSYFINIEIAFPLGWIILSVVVCTVLGIVSGLYPAWKASKLDPIDALRYE